MAYNRPVRALLDECAQALQEPFTPADIVEWFRTNYPDVQPSTIRAHITSLTAGGVRDPNLPPPLPPVLEQVDPGRYRRARIGTATPVPRRPPIAETATPQPQPRPRAVSSVVLVGSVDSKLPRAAPAKDLYRSDLFARRRRYAETTGLPWFVVTSRWGLAAPQEIIAPHDVDLGEMPSAYRRAWAGFVTAQLSAQVPLPGAVVEIHAGVDCVEVLRPELERAGAVVVDPVETGTVDQTLAWYDKRVPHRSNAADASVDDAGLDEVLRFLTHAANALTTAELRLSNAAQWSRPGVYSWWVDDAGAVDLSRGLGHRLEPGLIYVGVAGATRWPAARTEANTLWGRLIGIHLGSRANLSPFRTTLASILRMPLWAGVLDEDALTAWMDDHLRVAPLPVDDANSLRHMETAVLSRLDPPLNLSKMPESPIRSTLRRIRRELYV